MDGDPYPKVHPFNIGKEGVQKLLRDLNPHKANVPYNIPTQFLKELANEIAPMLTLVFQALNEPMQSSRGLETSPSDPIFKKGVRSSPVNYRPISITSVCSKMLEHIINSQTMKHLDANSILAEEQHGFRKKKRSCECQLILTLQDLAAGLDNGEQKYAMLFDFSKAYDKVPHERLFVKLKHYVRNQSSGEEYDVIVLGTGYKESVLSGMMSVSGKKVLTMDRNNYYGGESASLSPLDELFERFDQGTPGGSYGQYRDWNVDLIPKLIMGSGKFVKLLIHTGVTRYMEFKSVEDSYVYMGKDHKIHKIPDNQKEDLSSSWMGQSEKTRFQNLLMFIQGVDINDESTYNNFMEDINKPENNKANPLSLEQVTTKQMFDQFGIDENTQDVVGHAIALYRSEMYKDSPMLDIIGRVKLYYDSLSKYSKSPYLYPLYGLGELPQGFARLSAIYGGTYLLDKPGFTFMYGDNGKVIAVESNGEVYNTKMVICDPSYAPDNVNKVGEVVRAICILHHPLPNLPSDTKSCQIIIPQNQVNRKHDIYVSVVSYAYNVASKGFYLATVSTQVETSNPEQELQPGLDLLGPIFKKFVRTTDLYEPKEDSENSQVFISKSYDATSNFETTCDDILELFEKATGESFDFSKVKHIED